MIQLIQLIDFLKEKFTQNNLLILNLSPISSYP